MTAPRVSPEPTWVRVNIEDPDVLRRVARTLYEFDMDRGGKVSRPPWHDDNPYRPVYMAGAEAVLAALRTEVPR